MNRIIRANGETEPIPYPPKVDYISEKLGSEVLDAVYLHHLGLPIQVMWVDDHGIDKQLPINEAATGLYLANCKPGSKGKIYGDVAIVYENDLTD